MTPEDLSHLGIGLNQLESLVKLDGITRSEAEVVLFFGSFDASPRPSVEAGEIVSTADYQGHTLYRLSGRGGHILGGFNPMGDMSGRFRK